MKITYNIKNVTSELVNQVMFRKFFQMTFVGKDKKSLHIYTATVLGASQEEICQDEGNTDLFISDLEQLKQFRMRFEFSVGNLDDNDVTSIVHENITDIPDKGFLSEIECIRNVWGASCEVLLNDQKKLLDRYKKYYGEENECGDRALQFSTAELSKYKILCTEDEKHNLNKKWYESLSVAGAFEEVVEPVKKDERDEVSLRKAYVISVPTDIKMLKGMEIVNWIRTTIQFKYPFDDTNIHYVIKKENNQGHFWAPDFTWYFSPEIKSRIDTDKCNVEVKYGTREEWESCTCPVQNKTRTFYRKDKFENNINAVPNKLTVNFKYWTEQEQIGLRNKYRIIAREILPRPKDFSDISEINLFLDISDEHNRGNRQFMAGIILSTALAYGMDSSILEEISMYLKMLERWPLDMFWVFFVSLFALSLVNKPLKTDMKSIWYKRWRNINLILSIIMAVIVLWVFRIPWFEPLFTEKDFSIEIMVLYLIICVSHLLYLTNKHVKIKIMDFFNGDFL